MKRFPRVIGVLGFLLIAGVLLGVSLGSTRVPFHSLINALIGNGDPATSTLVWDLRMPRVAAALLAGACLGVAGCLLQSSTNNPLGDPQLFGIGGGAAVVQALAMAGIIKAGQWGLPALSVAASLVGAGVITFFASRRGLSAARLALIGVSISALAGAAATGIMAAHRVFSVQSLNFVGGSFSNRAWSDVVPALPFFVVGIAVALPSVGRLNVLALGDPIAANLGAEPGRTRALAITASGVLGGAAVAIAGLVGFVGLMVPHLARLVVGHDTRSIFIVSVPMGAAITILADQAARLVFMPSEVPTGLVTAIIGTSIMI